MRNRIFALMAGTLVAAGMVLSQSAPGQPKGGKASGSSAKDKSRSSEPFSIDGAVKDSVSNDGIPGVAVKAGSKHSTTTDAGGHFTLRGLDRSQAKYSLKIEKAPYTFTPDGKMITSPASGNVTNVRFTGTKPSKKK